VWTKQGRWGRRGARGKGEFEGGGGELGEVKKEERSHLDKE